MDKQSLLEKLKQHTARVTVIGLGYVGLPLLVEVARAGFHVTGYDISEERAASVNQGKSYIKDVPDQALADLRALGRIDATADPDCLARADVVIICVPTRSTSPAPPITATSSPPPRHCCRAFIPACWWCSRSTTFPGFTREVLLPRLSESGLKVGRDFYLAFSPRASRSRQRALPDPKTPQKSSAAPRPTA
jgi:UDP-N-acetyl-D-glucosamine dehydrogenase